MRKIIQDWQPLAMAASSIIAFAGKRHNATDPLHHFLTTGKVRLTLAACVDAIVLAE
jgi:hypothetical protein